jgi:hypothetical protein
MSNYAIKGGASCVWGVDETIEAAGTITDVQYDDVSIGENCENQEGAVDGVVVYDGNQTVKLTIVAKVSATPPAKDATLTIGTVAYLVTRVGLAKRHKGKNIFTVDAIHHDNMTLT